MADLFAVQRPYAPLVGRDAETAELDRAIDAAAAGATGRAVVFTGEPGIGKSVMLAAACAAAETAGFAVAHARASAFVPALAFGLIAGALDTIVAQRAAQWPDRLGTERYDDLAAVLPSLARLDDAAPRAPAHHRVRYAVGAVLAELAAQRPLLLALDDIHLADRASLEVVVHLLGHRALGRVLVVLAHREGRLDATLAQALAAAARDGQAVVVDLGPLGEDDCAQLLAGRVAEADQRAVFQRSGGNPFYLSELAREAPSEDDGVPKLVREAIRHELARLSPTARRLADAFAVVGGDVDLAARVADLRESSALGAVDELTRVGLTRTGEVPRQVAFRRPIVQRAIYDCAGSALALAAHARAADLLAQAGASPAARAEHVLRSARRGDEAAIAVLVSAAETVSSRTPADAVRWLRAAVRLLPADAAPCRRLELLVPLAGALGMTGEVAGSQAVLTDALELTVGDEPLLRARVVCAMARLDHMVGRDGEARALIDEALAAAGPGESAERATLQLELAIDTWLATEVGAIVPAAAAARLRAAAARERTMYAAATALEGLGRAYVGELRRAQALVDEAVTEIDRLPDSAVAQRMETLGILGHAEFAVERGDEATRHLRRGVALACGTGQDVWVITLRCLLALADIAQGRATDAVAGSAAALAASRVCGGQPLVWALSVHGWTTRVSGDLGEALARSQEAVAVARRTTARSFRWLAHGSLALALLESGDVAMAREEILTHAGGPELPAVEASRRSRWYAALTMAELQLGRLPAAEAWVKHSIAAAVAYPLDGRLGEARYAAAIVHDARGDHERAAQTASTAQRHFRAASWPIEASLAGIIAGRAWGATGDVARGRDCLRAAHAELAACGALRYRDEAAQELRQLGERVTRPAHAAPRPSGAGALSAREREVAELVVSGLTNREVAGRLFVSPKTVESHLARIFEKLDVGRRTALAGALGMLDAAAGDGGSGDGNGPAGAGGADGPPTAR